LFFERKHTNICNTLFSTQYLHILLNNSNPQSNNIILKQTNIVLNVETIFGIK